MHAAEPSSSEAALLAALRRGDEDAFGAVVDAHGAAMHRVALTFVRSRAVADEVVQEAWLGALRGLDRFEGRSALSTSRPSPPTASRAPTAAIQAAGFRSQSRGRPSRTALSSLQKPAS
jgi:hypothetical protein